jgi:hypothetical protein
MKDNVLRQRWGKRANYPVWDFSVSRKRILMYGPDRTHSHSRNGCVRAKVVP